MKLFEIRLVAGMDVAVEVELEDIAGDILADVVYAIEEARGPFDPELVVTEIHRVEVGEEPHSHVYDGDSVFCAVCGISRGEVGKETT